ncbi:ABC transporter substrate binding protein [Ruminiclostridium hungatei]|uniref:ABC transporter substrate binding protein n=1 Tax=Ruminiclostridium hungatei TaxID=48256 RepID=A0A1V4SIH3_RUMHU|nr:ABC transporter substrate-binding protein [Ruminiclostridium hungatei]OPX43614.1 ABC transporter substrate binding protein [Ruminiclostridium hungatei]
MKKINRGLLVVLSVAMLAGAAGCGTDSQNAGSKKLNIGIIQGMEHVALDSAREGFVEALKDNGYTEGQNISIDLQNAQGDQNNLSTISDRFVSNKADLVLAIGTQATQSIAGKTTEIPIVATAVTDFESAKLVDSNEAPGGNVTGTSDMNPIKEQMDLLVKLVPDAKKVGVMYNSSEVNSIVQAKVAKEAIEKLGLTYVEATVTNSNDVQQAAQSIVTECDVIYIPTDNTFASVMPLVSGVTTKAKIPVICGEANMVVSGGTATLGINYKDLGYQAGLMAVKILKGEAKPASMPIEGSKNFDYAINGTAANEIGLKIPADLEQYILKEK